MGWLGWKPDEVRYAHIAEIHLAYEGKFDMLKSCYGGGEEAKKQKPTANTVEEFDEMFGVR